MDNVIKRPDDIDPVLLEAVELELTLQSRMPFETNCESAVSDALAQTGGTLLFHMRPDADEPERWVGAVLFGSGRDAAIGLVTILEKRRMVSVERAERSDNPLARIAPAYAAVLTQFQAAA